MSRSANLQGGSLTPNSEEHASPKEPLAHSPAPPTADDDLPEQSNQSTRLTSFAVVYGTVSPVERFRASARKVIQLRRGPAVEPGIDARDKTSDAIYGHLRQNCWIEVIDYSTLRSIHRRMENKSFVEFMGDPETSKKGSWVKTRWINIGGISWDVLKALTLRYDLHPLAVSDIIDNPRGHSRSKADQYRGHLFIRVLCHSLANDGAPDTPPFGEGGSGMDEIEPRPPASSLDRSIRKRMRHPQYTGDDIEKAKERRSSLDAIRSVGGQSRTGQEEIKVERLKAGENVNVTVSPLFIFVLGKTGGTIISIHPTPDGEFTSSISNRLCRRGTKLTALRRSAHPALLVHSLLDLIIDSALEVIDKYHDTIVKLEHDILFKPQMKTVRYLHILAGDLALHKRTMEPIKTIADGLRRCDLARCAKLVDDHMDYILTSLATFESITENLIDYTFNMASYQTNEVMRRLTLATIIFLPPTLLTGYFGMNFTFMWSVRGHSDLTFWIIVLPVMAIVLPMFIYPDIVRMAEYVRKQMKERKIIKTYKQI